MATRLQQLRAKRDARADGSVFARLRRFGVWKLLFMMVGLGIVLGIASVNLIPLALRLGLAPRVADKLPYVGFAGGLLIGLAAAVSQAAMQALQIGLAIPLAVFALLGCALSVLLSLLWAVALADVLLIGVLASAVFAVVVVLVKVACERLGSGPARGE